MLKLPHICTHLIRQPTPVFLPGESQGWGSLVGCRLWGRTESDVTEQLHFLFTLCYVVSYQTTCVNLNVEPKLRSPHFLLFFLKFFDPRPNHPGICCKVSHSDDSFCHHHLSIPPNVRKESPTPNHHHLRDKQGA